ncbi:MurR/RpiR family transcriptional regulator [Martelella radicis]|uniref:DNA-binding MurR/RpiR family transcriptional regulator n=1 Tax=Martelella radicis TaxID=1397476 RepID=A0A7W6KFP2_9HYPH|nr:MurR/RpiR family transcriptional regulator [Martelella radicis]MBB4120361.1 DNA-binding MurR/RpiR family transcriptional regulator [Martelella radicis]
MTNDKTNPLQPRAFERRIKAAYESMPGSERVLADRVLEYPGDVIVCSATELADLAGSSKAAVTRFVKRLGYNDFRDMQKEIRHAQSTGDPIFLTSGRKKDEAEKTGLLAAHFEQDIDCMRQTLANIDEETALAVAEKIVSAKRIVCLGFRNSHFFAAYARRLMINTRPQVTVLPSAGQMLMEDMSDLGEDDLVFAVGLRRRARALGETMALLQRQNVPIAYITDRRAVSTTKYATWTLACHVRGTSLFDSYASVISLINFICTQANEIGGKPARQRLVRIEEMMDLLGELDSSN